MSREFRTKLNSRYQLEGKLGEGGMATVFKGLDEVLGRPVAVKILAPRFVGDVSFVHRFRREAQAAARLNHPNVVSVFDSGSDGNIHYIVMEYVHGRTLQEILRTDGRLQPERAVEIAESVAAALSFAHREGLIHRDIKPGNIMITSTGEVKVVDFGIARVTSSEALTQTATVLGTASYLSPEQAQGEPVDARSDVYSLGVVLYEMLTGQVPFTGDSAVAIAYKHVREDPVLPSRLIGGIGPNLEAVVMKALAKNPDNRYGTADEFRRDLQRLFRGEPVAATPVLPPDPTEVISREARPTSVLPSPAVGEEARGSRRWIAGAILAILLLAGLGTLAFFLTRSLLRDDTGPVAVPRVVGLPVELARERIEGVGLEVGVVQNRANTAVPEGNVIRQDPAEGEEVDEGTAVDLVVSTGAREVEVPNIVGLPEDEALALLDQFGLVGVRLASEQSDEFDVGEVTRQNPPEGAPAEEGDEVTYAVSTGADQVAVPNVVCLTFIEAATRLSDRGLNMEFVDDPTENLACPDPDRVAAQNPEAETEVEQGSAVEVFPALPPPTTIEPTPTASETGDDG